MPPIFRNPDRVQLLPERLWIRHYMPTPQEGFVAEDGDLIIDLFGPLIKQPYSANGRLLLIQIKYGATPMGYAQKRVYELMHTLMRKGDPQRRYYRGCYLIHWYAEEVTIGNHIYSLSDDSDKKELEKWLHECPDLIDKAKWWINHKKEQPAKVAVNGKRFTLEEFKDFLLEKLDVPSMFDEKDKASEKGTINDQR